MLALHLQFLVLDNASSHYNKDFLLAFSQAAITVIFLPAYSPQLNPIEEFFSKFKALNRRHASSLCARGLSDWAIINVLFRSISAENCSAWIRNAGYKFP
jgi:transposase